MRRVALIVTAVLGAGLLGSAASGLADIGRDLDRALPHRQEQQREVRMIAIVDTITRATVPTRCAAKKVQRNSLPA